MKDIKKLSLLLATVLVFASILSCNVFAHDDVKAIEENDKIYTSVPWEYEPYIYGDSLCYIDEEYNYIDIFVEENQFAPKGITALSEEQAQTVFTHFYLYDEDIQNQEYYDVKFAETKKATANGYSSYLLVGEYIYEDEEEYVYPFCAYLFATKENIFIVAYEKSDAETDDMHDILTAVSGIVLNGTHFDGDKPEINQDHDFTGSPTFAEAVANAEGTEYQDIYSDFDDDVIGIVIAVMVVIFIVPTVILIIVAIVLIVKYSKNKKKLNEYESAYGSVPNYNMPPQVFGSYNYGAPVNNAYQPNPANPNYPQTPSYVTNEINSNANTSEQTVTETPAVQEEVQNDETKGE